jgi:cobalamin-dependent methionine synthase I
VKDLESSLVSAKSQVASLTADLESQRVKTDKCQQNYERELQLHVEANKAVRIAEGLLSEEKKGKAELLSEVEALKAQLVTRESHYTTEK